MTASGFVTRRRRSPVSLGAAFAIQGVILAGLLSMAPKIASNPPKVFETVFFPEDRSVPPPVETQKPVVKPPISRIDTPQPIIDPPAPDSFVLPTTPPAPLPLGPIAGTGTSPVLPLDPPKPDPIMVGAQPDPRFARDFQPDYPGQLVRMGVEGKVTVKILVGTDGRVKAVQQVFADDPAFFRATEQQALRRWRFKPATRDGVAIESWREMTVRFRMES